MFLSVAKQSANLIFFLITQNKNAYLMGGLFHAVTIGIENKT